MGFFVEETRITPSISIEKGIVNIKGRSIPEDAFAFFNPVLKACEEYIKDPPENTDINVHLDYVNSGSKKFLTNILSVFERCYLKGSNFIINWYYDADDEAMHDLGIDLKGIMKIPLQIIESEE